MKKTIYTIIVSIIFGILIIFIYNQGNERNKRPAGSGQIIKISASFYPLYYLATEIGGDLVSVSNLTPAGAEPHDYELTNQDIYNIRSSKLLLLTGNLESWSPKIIASLVNSKVKVLRLGDIASDKSDPHFWLNPRELSLVADAVTEALSIDDPKNIAIYSQNAITLKDKLRTLDTKFETELKNCRTRDFVTSHNAFGYLASRYDLRQISIAGLSPEEEPSLKQLADVARFAKQNDIKYIFFESLLSPKLSETIAKEIGAKILVLNPLEGLTQIQLNTGLDYFTIMEDNLTNLKTALQCP